MSPLTQLQRELHPVIESHLKSFLKETDFGSSPELGEMLLYAIGWHPAIPENAVRGKRIRPFLMLLCHGAFNEDVSRALPGAVALELLHNFTLIHDDIEDDSPSRHGRPTLWKKWGIAQAINAGDALFSISQTAILSLEETYGSEITLAAAQQLNEVCLHLTSGQYLDIAFETESNVAVDTYLDMVEGKTAALIAFAASLGGLTGGQNKDIQKQLSEFGRRLGLAFQIQDDLLGIWGDPERTGKSTTSDLQTKKKSLPVLYGLAHCAEFSTIWSNKDPSKADFQFMSTLLEECGARSYATQEAKRHTELAFQGLEELFPGRNRFSNALFELVGHLLNRAA